MESRRTCDLLQPINVLKMTKPFSDNQQADRLEEIVAYLDGELPPEESAGVERRLAVDAGFRQELQGMERAWDALDQLPNILVDDNFSRTTMEMVVKAASEDVRQMTVALPIKRRKRRLATGLVALGAALAGLLVGRLLWDNPNQQLRADLPVIEYIDAYAQFRDVEYLRQLRPLFSAKVEQQSEREEFAQFQLVSVEDSRDDWLALLADEQRVSLRAKFNRFRTMTVEEQDRLRDLHAQIESDPESAELQQTMLAYMHWLRGLPASKQFELRDKPLDERLSFVRKSIRQQSKTELLTLTNEELLALYREIRPKLEQMRAAELQERAERQQKGKSGESRRAPPFWSNLSTRKLRQAVELMETIRNVLPQEKAEAFVRLEFPQKRNQLMAWMREAHWIAKGGDKSEQELERFFVEELDATEQEELLAMPLDQMQQQLRRMYSGSLPAAETREGSWDPHWAPPPPPQEGRGRSGAKRPPELDRSGDRERGPRNKRPFDGRFPPGPPRAG